MRNPARQLIVAALLFVSALTIELFALCVFGTVESRLADVFMRHHAAEFKADPNIVVIDIDDQSLAAMQEMAGLWAWPREIHADLLDALAEFSPRAVVFDIAFAERDRKRPKSDARLTESLLSMSPHVFLAATLLPNEDKAPPFGLQEVQTAFGVKQAGASDAQVGLLLPNAIDSKAWRLGLDNSDVDADGVLRRYRLRTVVGDWNLPSLPARVASDLGTALPAGDSILLSWPASGRIRHHYSDLYRSLTEDRPDMREQDVRHLEQTIRGKILVIGSSATGAFDHHLTPLGASFPGVDVLATAIDNLVNDRYLRVVPPLWPFLYGALLIASLTAAFAKRMNPLAAGAVLLAVTALSLIAADQAMAKLWMLPLATPLIFAWTWFLSAALAGYLRERRTREQAVSLFRRFLNPEVVRRIVDQGETVDSMSGRTSEISVLFSDIRGFTTLSESHPPQQVVALLNRYFDRQVEVVFKHGGTLDKFIGDCIMAFWGAPLADPQHASRAVAAALEMQENLLLFKKELAAEQSDLTDFDVGIGVHTGPAVVGFIGARRKLDYTAIGDTVNLASRVEGLTKDVARVLVSRETMQACSHDANVANVTFMLRGTFSVKGRAAEVELYEPIGKNA
ncbi:MAG: adenylate/guanylate cyclase domain-containing protein [Burkholderiaceae bacterium]|nr:adenylate/guanylate cyclase domain-containing protein [Burkholderiaceae bacterium]